MAVLDFARKEASEETPGKIPKEVKDRLDRGREAMMKDASKRRMLFKMWRGQQYCWVDTKGVLQFQPTVTNTNGTGKQPHRVRTTRNFIKGRVQAKVSAATNRTPGYDVLPASTDPEDYAGARMAKKAVYAGMDKWGVRKARIKAVTNALVADGGFAMPYFDPNVGPFHEVDGEQVGEGEIKILTLHGSQVAWEPGCDFDESPWHAIIRAQPIDEVKKTPGYDGKGLRPDASTSDVPTDRPTGEMCLVTEFFERPCPEYPQGRKLTIANTRVIRPVEDYPCRDAQGNVVDEPVIHQIVYTVDPDSDRDMGLVEDLVDTQRTINDAASKISEWKNRCLMPQLKAAKGSVDAKDAPTDEPGFILWYKPGFPNPPEWQPTPPVPQELFQIVNDGINQMKDLASDADVDAGSNVAAKTVQAVIEQSANQWATFLAALAEFDSRLMRHCLYLVARHYSEPRLLQIRGHAGWEPIPEFRGADIRGQTDVRVLPDSLISQTRQGMREEIQFFVSMFPGAVTPEAAWAAWHGGMGESLIQGYEYDLAACGEVIRAIVAGPDVLFSKSPQIQMRPNPMAGQPNMETGQPEPEVTPQEVPWWMPGPSANVRVWKQLFGDWLKSPEYRDLEPGMQQAANDVYDALLQLEAQEAARQASMQTQLAEQQGAANAAAPQQKPLPSQPALEGQ